MPYPPEHKKQTRERILRCAHQLFNRRGFTDVSIDEIMAAAGLTRGGFYHHFKTKEDLLLQIYAFMSKHVIAAGDEVEPERQLQTIIERSFELVEGIVGKCE